MERKSTPAFTVTSRSPSGLDVGRKLQYAAVRNTHSTKGVSDIARPIEIGLGMTLSVRIYPGFMLCTAPDIDQGNNRPFLSFL